MLALYRLRDIRGRSKRRHRGRSRMFRRRRRRGMRREWQTTDTLATNALNAAHDYLATFLLELFLSFGSESRPGPFFNHRCGLRVRWEHCIWRWRDLRRFAHWRWWWARAHSRASVRCKTRNTRNRWTRRDSFRGGIVSQELLKLAHLILVFWHIVNMRIITR